MAVLHLNLTEDHLKLIRFINFDDSEDGVLKINRNEFLTMRTHILDDVALILGLRDKAIPNTTEDADGSAYPDDVEKYMLDTYHYVSDNLHLIESLIHQFVFEGVKVGKYKCVDYEMIWKYEGE